MRTINGKCGHISIDFSTDKFIFEFFFFATTIFFIIINSLFLAKILLEFGFSNVRNFHYQFEFFVEMLTYGFIQKKKIFFS